MSQDNHLETSHLCTTEDAFEKFQSVNMYEDDEFFTLSDIVPPQAAAPDLSNELSEIPYDNEVILSSTENDDALPLKCTVESNHGPNSKSGTISDTLENNQNLSSDQNYNNGSAKNSKRLSKQKSKSQKNITANQKNKSNVNEMVSDNFARLDNQAIQDAVLSTTVGKNDTESINDMQQESKHPRRTKRERIPNISKYPLTSGTVCHDTTASKTPGKRRGRPKKSLEKLSISEPDSTNIDIMLVGNENVTSSESERLDESTDLNSINQNAIKKGSHGRSRISPTNKEQMKLNESSSNIMNNDLDVNIKDTKKHNQKGRKKITRPKLLDNTAPIQESTEGFHSQIPETHSQLEVNDLSAKKPLDETTQLHHDVDVESLPSDKPPGKQVVAEPIASTRENMEESLHKLDNIDDDEDADDICLSKLKENMNNNTNKLDVNVETEKNSESCDSSAKRNPKVPLMADFEYNIDKIVNEASSDGQIKTVENKESLLVEDTSKRPNRRKAKQNFKYDEDSDEDPFANVELSEDDEPKTRKKGRYNDDDEYIPGKKKGIIPMSSSDTDSELNEELGEGKKQKRKKIFKNSESQSPRKRGRKKKDDLDKSDIKVDVTEIQEDSMTKGLETSLTKPEEEKLSMKPPAEAWATSNEFENFIAQKIQGTNLKIKKLSSKQKSESVVTPLEIPVLDQNKPKKVIEISTQTKITPINSTGVQTSVPYDIPMKTNIGLSSQQSKKACQFLNSVVKTTVELGQLMTEKSQDFMKKKINSENVTDTFKMDYCVRKSFLLFKLAKHNLMQMEEDLAKQYDEFLISNGLSSCREDIKNLTPKPKAESDSDCEIVDVKEGPSTSKKEKEKQKFNPKTVFLNKELSIKIAKKPSADKNIDVKKRHTVWINDSVMVKKVKPTQSFLAQDSRNKKPPDFITEKMVSNFFDDYYRQKALAVCGPYINPEWRRVYEVHTCHYFVKCNNFNSPDINTNEINMNVLENNASTSNGNCNEIVDIKETHKNNPKSLSILCTELVHKCWQVGKADNKKEKTQDQTCHLTDSESKNHPLSLFRLCMQILSSEYPNCMSNKPLALNNIEQKGILTVLPLKTLCYRRIAGMMASFQELGKKYDATNESSQRNYKGLYALTNDEYVSDCSHESDILFDTNNFDEEWDDDENVFHDATVLHSCIQKNNVKESLLTLCVKSIQNNMFADCNKTNTLLINDIEKFYPMIRVGEVYPLIDSPRSLKHIVYENVKSLIYGNNQIDCFIPNTDINTIREIVHNSKHSEDFTINCINTMSEEAFHSLQEPHEFQDDDDFDYEPDIADFEEDNDTNGNEWASQVQMHVLSSLVTSSNSPPAHDDDEINMNNTVDTHANITSENEFADTNITTEHQYQGSLASADENPLLTAHVKLEPLDDDLPENVDSSIVKTEPVHGLDGMTIIPESVMTKREMIEHVSEEPETPISAYDVNTFEQFVRTNKIMRSMEEYCESEEIFSQSALRIRRQHEPDYDAENDMNMSLLIPQTSEPLLLENAKGSLIESSDDENRVDSGAKKGNKKKMERKKGKQKKAKENTKNNNSKELPTCVPEIPSPVKEVSAPVKEKPQNVNEVAMLTRRMREKIRQEEKKIESSDSEIENTYLSLRKDKSKKDGDKIKSTKHIKEVEYSKDKTVGEEIQCNNVDSTEQILENKNKIRDDDKFTGFSVIDQNEMSSYQKYMQFVYDKIIPGDEDSSVQENGSIDFDEAMEFNSSCSPVINPDQPVEMLECEPTMPIFDNETQGKELKRSKRATKKNKLDVLPNETPIVEKKHKKSDKTDGPVEPQSKESIELERGKSNKKSNKIEVLEKVEVKFKEYDGWHLYSVNTSDAKLYQNCLIPLEKLPESFVDTYLEYHDITNKDDQDKEVDRLANLHTLNRGTGIKEVKSKGRQKRNTSSNGQSLSEHNSRNGTRSPSPANSDRYDELTPSEDDGANVDDELPPPVPIRATENNVAKNSLMNDQESDSDSGGIKKIKQELVEYDQVEVKTKPGPKSKTKIGCKTKFNTNLPSENKTKVDISPSSESLMLTADKMMNKELSLLYAPVNLKQEVKETPAKEPSSKKEYTSKRRHAKNMSLRDRFKTEDDSSSEEEKQWVSTKEKLLKKMGKKEDASVDDAKRAKLVDDFIERRGDAPGKRRPHVGGSRRSRKKFLERLKQQSFLSKELFGESSTDLTPGSKRGAAAGLFKGRRNIRKVIDKKSLQKGTVLANIEELERKRRLNSRQNQLRELLGCEEGVNVLVINDEVCLEYDFEEQRPVVTVHPFFTKVMKAHQYEGVKFMWDACFESLQSIESGRGGGGCILAHCMGLGKTLQVLALLHTVLTHPRVGMQRVLVCCPLSTVLNWVDEIHKWIGPVTDQIKVFELSKLKKTYERAYQLEDWYSGGGIFIIGYELFRSLTTLDPFIDEIRPTIINKIRTALIDPGPDIVICDEGHLLKNDCSVLAVAMSRVVTKRRIILTGTPMQNNLREYYCMVNFVKPNLLGTYSEYSNRFENPIMNGQHRDSREEDIKLMKARTHILHKVLEGCLQRQEASVLYPYLPKKHEYTVFIPLTKCQWDLYKHYVHNYTKKSKQSVLKDFHILQKIWSHPQVLHNFQIKARDDTKKKDIKPEKVEDDLALEDKEDIKPPETEVWWLQYLADGAMLDSLECSNKFVAVFRILHECVTLGDKLLIFSTSLFCLDALEYFLKQIKGWSLGQEYYRLDGSVPAEVRQKWVREFNAENNIKTKLFLISTRAGCLGLNMTAANRVIILDTSWNPAHDIQSIFRVYRFGQKKDCYIYRLVAMGTMEQKIYERSVTKQAVACRVVDEQQIDRHYNMAELTELYRFDEFGSGVAGGVAVGVGDVALLRVARDAAVHAVHEHDSLLRGSGEQGLPEHERAAAWMQFQQEHTHKQMQNDLESEQAARALKLLQEPQIVSIKTEDGPVHGNLPPKPVPPAPGKGMSRKRGRKIVQCRIPIKPDGEAGPSRAQAPMGEAEMVQQISDILIKHNFTQTDKGPKQIKELVTKVKHMIQTGEPMSFEGDNLSASIASVLLQQKVVIPAPEPPPMPALTDIEEPKRTRGRPRKSNVKQDEPLQPIEPVQLAPEVKPTLDIQMDENTVRTRSRRKAALAAERHFDAIEDTGSQDSIVPDPVIELDDDWHGGSDTDSATEVVSNPTPVTEQKPILTKVKKEKGSKRTASVLVAQKEPDDSSIVLSDDEPLVQKPQTPPPAEETITPLHPSLLSNQNFIKIVAHTYLAGNPMFDEDVATLAARHSTAKLLEEAESTGRPIVSGPIYEIAIKVLGIEVLQKLQSVDTKTKNRSDSNAASSKMMQLLKQTTSETTTPTGKRKSGPKSRVKEIKEEPKEIPKPDVLPPLPKTNIGGIVPVTLVKLGSTPSSSTTASASLTSDECILPDDDDDVRCITEPSPTVPPIKIKLRMKPVNKEQDIKPKLQTTVESFRVTSGNVASPGTAAPAPTSKQFATICLDSDDDEPPPAPAMLPSIRALRAARLRAALQNISPAVEGPVPVALTGPDSKPIPLAMSSPAPPPAQFPPSTQAGYYPTPVSVTASNATYTDPVPICLTGPDSRPVPISLTGPGFQGVPISLAGPGLHAVPSSYVSTDTVNVPYSGAQSFPMTFTVPSSSGGGVQPVAMTYVGGGQVGPASRPMTPRGAVRAVRVGTPAGQPPPKPGTVAHQVASNIYLVPTAPAGERLLTRVPASQVPQSLHMHASAPAASPTAPPPPTPLNQTLRFVGPNAGGATAVCKPGDILRLTNTGQIEVLYKNPDDVVHTIDDDDPVAKVPVPTAKTPVPITKPPVRPLAPKPTITKAPTTKPPPPQKPTPQPPTPKPAAAKEPPPKPAQQASLLKPINDDVGSVRRTRRVSSSSSSSSDSSRSPSPDPLSILKDVVHIQAPERRKTAKPPPNKPGPSTPKQTSANNQSNNNATPKPTKPTTTSNDRDKRKEDIIQKLSNVLSYVKSKPTNVTKVTLNKAALVVQKSTTSGAKPIPKIKDSIDLTETNITTAKPSAATPSAAKPGVSKPGMSKPGMSKPGVPKPTIAKPGDSSKNSPVVGKSTVTPKKDGPTTVVGTSKNIVLDGKSKSLTNTSMVDLTGQKSVQVTNVKTIPPSASKHKPPDKKRPAPALAPDTAAPKKKKTELMTLKDFDLDDIDDIIELD